MVYVPSLRRGVPCRYYVDQTKELCRYKACAQGRGYSALLPPLAEGNHSLGARQVCRLMFNLLWLMWSGAPPGLTVPQQTWPGSGQTQPFI